ncbi:hypothetical protein CJ010_00800 [Azoarcus sp. DD4]|uniref:phage tail fiber protein n=1 Tax=Azoarcus sp. DD4 TaxID=2027405 RepID=UPI00112C9478|nr:hypothetical protein [Azoarcus sp. DD4]QDF95191.1 hypothetical protein CJ010_00800 [Azoarcus sp. DD4]
MKKKLFTLALAACALVTSLPAAAGALTDHGENKSLDALLRGQSLGAPATWYIGLTTDTCTDAGAGTEPSGGAYARVSVASSLANWAGTQGAGTTVASSGTSGTTSNNGVITFPESTASWGNLQAVRWYDATTAGNAWICLDLTTAYNVSAAGITVKFNAGTLQFQVDN